MPAPGLAFPGFSWCEGVKGTLSGAFLELRRHHQSQENFSWLRTLNLSVLSGASLHLLGGGWRGGTVPAEVPSGMLMREGERPWTRRHSGVTAQHGHLPALGPRGACGPHF